MDIADLLAENEQLRAENAQLRAENQQLRPAVVARKTGGCNRTDVGAEAHAILASVLRTCTKQGCDPIAILKH